MLALQPFWNIRPRVNIAVLGVAMLVGVLAMFLGLASVVLPWWLVIGIVVAPATLVIGLRVPEIGIALTLILVCGLLPAGLSPSISVGPGNIKAPELMIVVICVWALLRIGATSPLRGYWSWLVPVLLLLGLMVVSAAVAYVMFRTPAKTILADARQFISWLIVLPIVVLIRSEQQMERLLKAIIFVGCIVAAAALVQFVLGRPIIENARVEDLVTLNKAADVTRSIVGPGNYFLIFSMLLLLARLMTRSVSRLVALPLIGLLLAGLIVNFGRGLWIAAFASAVLLAFWLFRWRGVWRVAVTGTAALVLSLGLLAAYKPQIIEASYDRLVSSGHESLERNTTLGWRLEETTAALGMLRSYPVTGIGLGTSYKPAQRMNGMFLTEQDEVLTRYIHNGYLGVWLKFGLLGPIVLVGLIAGVFRRALRFARQARDIRLKTLFLSTAAGFFVPVVTCVTQPEWLSQAGISFFATIIGLQIVAHRVLQTQRQATETSPDDAPPRQIWMQHAHYRK